jgi:hypothetical protein
LQLFSARHSTDPDEGVLFKKGKKTRNGRERSSYHSRIERLPACAGY